MNSTGRDPLPRRLEITNWLLLVVLLAVSLFWGSTRFSLGVLSGGLISIANFLWLYRSLRTVFSKDRPRGRAALMFRYYLRLVLTGLVLYWLISGDRVDVIGLVIGLSVIVMTLLLTTLLALSGKKRIEEA